MKRAGRPARCAKAKVDADRGGPAAAAAAARSLASIETKISREVRAGARVHTGPVERALLVIAIVKAVFAFAGESSRPRLGRFTSDPRAADPSAGNNAPAVGEVDIIAPKKRRTQ